MRQRSPSLRLLNLHFKCWGSSSEIYVWVRRWFGHPSQKEIGRKPGGHALVICHALAPVLRQSRGGIGWGPVGLEIRAKRASSPCACLQNSAACNLTESGNTEKDDPQKDWQNTHFFPWVQRVRGRPKHLNDLNIKMRKMQRGMHVSTAP